MRLVVALGLALVIGRTAGASVVISEIMYHPISDSDDDEFLELLNTGPTIASLQGWCFDGVDFCFPSGAVLGAGAYVVLARDAARFETTYGFAPDFVYGAKLSNSGERLALFNSFGQIVDEVAYTDLPPWPVTPDGLGPSLEIVDPEQDNGTPRNWRASTSLAQHTAGAVNSVAATGLPPWIDEVTHDRDPLPGEAVAVTARIEDAPAPQLHYAIDFDPEQVVPLLDDGLSGDGLSGDGVYGASIPGQNAATLIRFRIVADGPTGTIRWPRSDDTVTYDGTVVADPGLSSELPIFQWYMAPADYQSALNHRYTDETEPAVLYYDGVLYDNIRVRVRGQSARSWPKKHWKFKFPQGHDFFSPGLVQSPADNFDLQSSYGDKSWMREYLTYTTFADAGSVSHQVFHVRLQQNGGFYGLYVYVEDPDADWVVRNGLSETAARYKCFSDLTNPGSIGGLVGSYEKQSRLDEDYSDLFQLVYGVNNLGGAALRDFLFDNIDLPATLNYIAIKSIVHDNDHVAKNYFVYRDTDGTGRWTIHPWDSDLTFGRNYNSGGVLNDTIWADVDTISGRANVSPSHPLFGDSEHQKFDNLWNRLIDRLHEEPAIRQMYYRRLRTLADTLLAPGRYENMIDNELPHIATEAQLDRQKWGWYGQSQTPEFAAQRLEDEYLAVRRTHLLNTHRVPGELPDAQDPLATVVINELMYNPSRGGNLEFVELYNPSPFDAIDLSRWRVEGIGLTVPAGTVILPQSYALLVADDVAFRGWYGGSRFIPAQYGGSLANEGERIVLSDNTGREVASVDFSPAAPWPSAPDGAGPSLELIDPQQPNGWVSNWAASTGPDGTPGAINSRAGTLEVFPGVFVNEVLPVNVSVNIDEQDEHEPWIELFNASGTAVVIGGMFLSDNLSLPFSWQIPSGTTMCGGCWSLIWADGEPADGPLHASFRLAAGGGRVGLFSQSGTLLDFLNYGAIPSNTSIGRYPDGSSGRRQFTSVTPLAENDATLVPLILNEYNAVAPTGFLGSGAADPYWGRVPGNGGNWLELVVTADHVDMRGWELRLSDDTGGSGESVVSLFLTDDPLWSDVPSGTIITVSEDLADDVSLDPAAGDWWINIQAADGASGRYVTAANFEVSNRNWQLTIFDAAGDPVFGPAGEGVIPESGIGNDEVFKLEEDPGPFVTPYATYNDGTSSTFGAPNQFAAGTLVQSFDAVRCGIADCAELDSICGDGYCDTTVGQCASRPKNEELTCDDGNLCTDSETCVSGYCTGSSLDCTAFDDSCNIGVCNPASGTCSARPVNQGLACDDGVPCTENDVCHVGSCSGTTVDCTGVNDGCNLGVCNPSTGACESTPRLDGTTCAPDACTTAGSCESGVCTGGTTISCVDGNSCTVDGCDPQTGCVYTADDDQDDDGQPDLCDDGSLCTDGDVCSAGSCIAVPRDCAAWSDSCNAGLCDPATGACKAVAVPNGTFCDDGDACTSGDSCDEGTCASGAALACDDGDACTDDACDPVGGCVHSPDPGAQCDDGNPCTDGDTCDAGGACSGTPVAELTPCDDGALCTSASACLAGVCSGSPIDCSGLGDPCNAGACDPATGQCRAVPLADGADCDDGNPCTSTDACHGGTCAGEVLNCAGLDDTCNVGMCDPESGACLAQPVADGTACDDTNACSIGETCNGGLCGSGAQIDCDDGIACTADACNPAIGCSNAPVDAVCDDGDACNGPEGCDPAFDCVTCPGGDAVTVDEIADATGGAGVPLEFPDGIAVDDSGTVYVAGSGVGINDGVFKILPGGEPLPILGLADGVSLPVGLDTDAAGNVYVASYLNDRVFRIEPSGVASVILDAAGDGDHALDGPVGIVADPDGRVIVSGYHSDNVFEIRADGSVRQLLGPEGDGSSPLRGPKGLAIGVGGTVWIAGRGSDNVFRVESSGAVEVVLDAQGDGQRPLAAPEGLAVDGWGAVYVAGNGSDNVFRVAANGEVSLIADTTGDRAGHVLDGPTCVAVDGDGNVFVAGYESHNVFKVRPDGRVGLLVDATGDGEHSFFGPTDDCLDVGASGTVHLVGTLSRNVFRVDASCAAEMSCDDGDLCSADSCLDGACLHDASGTCGVGGAIRYYRDSLGQLEPSAKPVPGVEIDVDGDLIADAVSDVSGAWSVDDRFGALAVRPLDRFGDPRIADHNGAITSFDASYIAQYAVQSRTLSANQLVAADVTGNGSVTSFDAAKVSQFAVQVLDHFEVALIDGSDWAVFRCDHYASADDQDCVSPLYSHDPLVGPAIDDFDAVLYGDVTGNWAPAAAMRSTDAESEAAVRDREEAGRLAGTARRLARRAPGAGPAVLKLKGAGGAWSVGERRDLILWIDRADGIEALDLELGDSTGRLRIVDVERTGLSSGLALVVNPTGGVVRVAIYGAEELRGSGPVLVVTVEAVEDLLRAPEFQLVGTANEGRVPLRISGGHRASDGGTPMRPEERRSPR